MQTQTSTAGLPAVLGVDELTTLRAATTGPVLVPGDDGYSEELATYNLTAIHRPAVVVGASGASDVQAAVRFAAARDLPVAVLATGHGTAASSDGAVMITTRRMTALTVDTTTRTARVEAGVLWQDVIAEAAKAGLVGLNGSSPGVSVVGYTLGGGLGPFGRAFGYAADHVRRLEVVTADGRLRDVTPGTDADLFWALRGAKGNFGVVTAMTFDLFGVTEIYGGGLYFPGDQAAAALRLFRRWAADVPEEMSASVALMNVPPLPFVPEPLRGRRIVHVRVTYLGTTDDGDRLIAPFRALGPRLIDTVGALPYPQIGSVHADPVDPLPVYESGTLLRELSEGAVDVVLDAAGPQAVEPPLVVELRHLGGALGRYPDRPNAVGNRDAGYSVFAGSVGGPSDGERLLATQRALVDRLAPWETGQRYLNFMFAPDATPERTERAFDPDTYARLAVLKDVYDPTNMFRVNHNIPPRAQG